MDEERPQTSSQEMGSDGSDLDEPLLRTSSAEAPSPPHFTMPVLENGGGTSIPGSIGLLAKAIIGAGSAALPLAFARLGIIFSASFLLLIGFMTHYSLEALTLGIVTSDKPSYPAVVHSLLGHSAGAFLELCLVLRCAGLMIVYIVISADLLAGSKALPGILCELFSSSSSGTSTDSVWCSDRYLVSGILAVFVLVPLVTPKRLSSATWASIAGLVSVVLWTIVTAVIAITAAAKGFSFSPSWLPDSGALGGGSITSQTIVALATLPVIATAYTCQMTVAFIIGELRNFSSNRMATVSAAAVSLCSAVFLIIGLGSVTAFGGEHIPADILELFSISGLEAIVGFTAGKILGISVRLGFMVSILANMPLQMLPFRQSLARLVLGGDQELAGIGYYVVTYGSLVAFYFIAMAATSIWLPIQLVGATAGAAIAFFYPAMVALAVVTPGNNNFLYWRLNAWGLIAIGAVQVVTGISAVLLEGKR